MSFYEWHVHHSADKLCCTNPGYQPLAAVLLPHTKTLHSRIVEPSEEKKKKI